jgi:hypothetical protein
MPVLLHKIWQVLGVLRKHLGELERKYARFQSRTASNFKLRISLLLVFSFINVLVGAVVYQWVTSEGWGDAMFTVYAVSVQAAAAVNVCRLPLQNLNGILSQCPMPGVSVCLITGTTAHVPAACVSPALPYIIL